MPHNNVFLYLVFSLDIHLILSEHSEEKLEESQGIARDAAIAVGRHVSPRRGKG